MPISSTSIDQHKILIVGDSATGKHAYVKRLTHNTFSSIAQMNVS